ARQVRKSLVLAVGRSILEDEVLALNVPELTQPLPEGPDIGRVGANRRPLDHADAVDPPRLLRGGGERGGETRAHQAAQERPAADRRSTDVRDGAHARLGLL